MIEIVSQSYCDILLLDTNCDLLLAPNLWSGVECTVEECYSSFVKLSRSCEFIFCFTLQISVIGLEVHAAPLSVVLYYKLLGI